MAYPHSPLGEFAKEALRVLARCSGDSGFDVKWISHHSRHPYCRDFPRARSGALSHALKAMASAGLVRRLDGQRPTVWVITEAGRTAAEN